VTFDPSAAPVDELGVKRYVAEIDRALASPEPYDPTSDVAERFDAAAIAGGLRYRGGRWEK
jgi:hypothetical protein